MVALRQRECLRWIKTNVMLILNIIAVAIGIIGGGLLRYAEPSQEAIHIIGYPGTLFMNMLKMMIIPLISASLVSESCTLFQWGIVTALSFTTSFVLQLITAQYNCLNSLPSTTRLAQLDARSSGRVGSRAVAYYALTTTHAVILGIIIVMLIHPGHPDIKRRADEVELEHGEVSALHKFLDLVRNMFPDNIVRAAFQQAETVVQVNNSTGRVKYLIKYNDGMNVLGLIVFCIVMGIVVSSLGKPAKAVGDFFIALDIVITKMVGIYMWFGPIGICSLVMEKMLEVENLAETAAVLGWFILTVVSGLAIQAFITLPLIYFVATRKNPFVFLKGLIPAILTAFGTSSSAATLPITFQCLRDIGVDTRITKFVLPVGAMINMDGTALYEAVGSIFIAQLNGLEMNIGQIITVSVTATLASIGAASIPSAGLVTMIIVLTALGLPSNDISLILAIDFLLDRLRTAVNVIGDAFGCGFVESLCEDSINELPEDNELEKDHMNHWGHESQNTLGVNVNKTNGEYA